MECCENIEILNIKALETKTAFDVMLSEVAEYKIRHCFMLPRAYNACVWMSMGR